MAEEFFLNGNVLKISDGREFYNDYRKMFIENAALYAEEFGKRYDRQISDLDDLAKYGYGMGSELFADAVSGFAIESLIVWDIYDIDNDRFINEYYKYYHTWDDDFGVISDKYMEIVLKGQQLDEYRKARRLSRGSVIGGGFGLQGAAVGMVQAGAINMVFGAAHATFNGISKIISMGIDSYKKNQIFNDPSTKQTLVDGFYRAVFNIHYALIDILEERIDNLPKDTKIKPEDEKRADATFNNIKNRKFDKALLSKLVTEILTLNPYKIEYYKFALAEFWNETEQIDEIACIANYFGINLDQIKEELDDRAQEKRIMESSEFVLKVSDEFNIPGRGLIFAGEILKGEIRIGDIITTNTHKQSKVGGVEINRKLYDRGMAGDTVGLLCTDFKDSGVAGNVEFIFKK